MISGHPSSDRRPWSRLICVLSSSTKLCARHVGPRLCHGRVIPFDHEVDIYLLTVTMSHHVPSVPLFMFGTYFWLQSMCPLAFHMAEPSQLPKVRWFIYVLIH